MDYNISSVLKQLRKTAGYSANDTIEKLKEYNIDISSKTLYGYESGLSMPNANVFVSLCKIYHCDNPMVLFGNSSFSNDELTFIQKYRQLDEHGQETISLLLDRELGRVTSMNEQLQAKNQRIATLEAALNQSGAALRIYTYMRKIAAAGTGFYFDDIPTDTIEAPYCEKADFIIGVNGDSMEPTFRDGDLVYVEKCQGINIGEIGIFMLNNECYIKEADESGLHSHNPKYNDIPGTDQIICVGRVLGKVDL